MSVKVAGFKASDIFEQLASGLKSNSDLVSKMKAIYRFNVEDNSGKTASWIVDLKNGAGSVAIAKDEDTADCTISTKDDIFVDLMQGKADSSSLFFSGDLKIDGKMNLAMKLSQLTKALTPKSKL